MSLRDRPTPLSRHRLAILAVALSLGACASRDPGLATGSIEPADTRLRHPIVLTDQPRVLDVFPTGIGHIDPRQQADVEAFLLEYRRYGRGVLAVQMPRGSGPRLDAAAANTLANLRRLVAANAVPARALVVSNYPVEQPAAAAALRMSFQRMQAKVATTCGEWPADLGFSDGEVGLNNTPYHNLGCATQSNVASQIADPVDLVRGRAEGRIDTIRRTKDIDSLRAGRDPSTQWRQDGQSNVKQQVAQ